MHYILMFVIREFWRESLDSLQKFQSLIASFDQLADIC